MRESINARDHVSAAERSTAEPGDASCSRGLERVTPSQSSRIRALLFAAVLQNRHADPAWQRYLFGLALWMLSFAMQLMIRRLTPFSPFLLFIPGLMLVAWLWGRGPA